MRTTAYAVQCRLQKTPHCCSCLTGVISCLTGVCSCMTGVCSCLTGVCFCLTGVCSCLTTKVCCCGMMLVWKDTSRIVPVM